MNDPKTVIDAVLQTQENTDGVVVYPITLARYALLEIVESPFTTSGKPMTTGELIPSLFIICSPKEVLKKYNTRKADALFEDAFEWAEGVDPASLNKIMQLAVQKIQDMMSVAPTSTEDDNSKKKE